MSKVSIKTAFILGAGLGIRLRPLTEDCPKPLLPVGGRPMITYAMDHLLTAEVRRFIVNTHHLADAYKHAFLDNHWRAVPIIFRYEPVLLDTAGGLKNIEDLLKDDEDILVYNGDVISNLPLSRLLAAHEEGGAEVTLVLRSNEDPRQVTLNEHNEVCDIRDTLGRKGKKCLFTGIYAVKRDFLNRLKQGRRESVITIFLEMIRDKPGAVAGVIIDEGLCHDAGSLQELERINELLNSQKTEFSTF